jgi:hypothetical protein
MQLRNGKVTGKTVVSQQSFVKKEDDIYNNEIESFDIIYNRVINKHVPYIKELLYLQSISNTIKEKTKYAFDIYTYLQRWMNDLKIPATLRLYNKIINQIPVLIDQSTLNLIDMNIFNVWKYDNELVFDLLQLILLLNTFQKKHVYNL